MHKGERSHKLVRRADHVGAFWDLGGTWALSPKGGGSHGRMLSIEEVQSSHILTTPYGCHVENELGGAKCARWLKWEIFTLWYILHF